MTAAHNNITRKERLHSFSAPYVWKVLIADDEEDVHRITKLAMMGVSYKGKPIEFLSAYSAQEAKEILSANNDIAVALLDVVMETEDAGLQLANYIRNDLHDHLIRIVLRTGQPGQAPEDEILDEYDIDDYRDKTDMSSLKLRTLIRTNLHSYQSEVMLWINSFKIVQINDMSHALVNQRELKSAVRMVVSHFSQLLTAGKHRSCEYRVYRFFVSPVGTMIVTDFFSEEKIERNENNSHVFDTIEKEIGDVYGEHATVLCLADFDGLVIDVTIPDGIKVSPDKQIVNLFQETLSNHYRNIRISDRISRDQREVMYHICEIVETRSKESGMHVKRVSAYCGLLAKLYGLPPEEIELIEKASPLHDLGKIAIPDKILHKPGKLDPEEWQVMKTHSQVGYDLLRDSEIELFQTAAQIAISHHEKWNGTGYPQGISGEAIPLYGRICAIADVFDALASDRCYKKKWPLEKVFALFQEERGHHFDPDLTDLFIAHFDEFVSIKEHLDETETEVDSSASREMQLLQSYYQKQQASATI